MAAHEGIHLTSPEWSCSIARGLRYGLAAILWPVAVFDEMRLEPQRLSIGLWLLFLFSLAYSLTVLIFYLRQILPGVTPWIPIPLDRYYLYQACWTIPWGMGTGLMMAGTAHVFGVLGRRDAEGCRFDDGMTVAALSWLVPSFVLMWLPETFIVPFAGNHAWPGWVDLVRLAVLSPAWQIALATIGMRRLYNTGWPRSILTGLVLTALGFGMFLPIMR
jgi:hypothetical protein